jgi:hypothetical protein
MRRVLKVLEVDLIETVKVLKRKVDRLKGCLLPVLVY